MTEPIELADLPARVDELMRRTGTGQRFLVMRDGRPLFALVSVSDLTSLEETDEVLAEQGVLEALRESRALAGEDATSYDS
jgi:prevent-host-death family protein